MTIGAREEFKTFADITNRGALRQVLRELGFHIVVHGHKHETAVTYDHICDDRNLSAPAHRILNISGGTFDVAAHSDAMRLIEIEQAGYAPKCKVTPVPVVSAGRQLPQLQSVEARVWEDGAQSTGPIVIEGSRITEVYERAIQVANGAGRPLICVLNLPESEDLPIPETYPYDAVSLSS